MTAKLFPLGKIFLSFFLLFTSHTFAQLTFGEQKLVTDKTGGADAHSADLNDDGLLDILTGNLAEGIISWRENLGSGTFSDAIIISSNANSVRSVHAQDLDGDGDYDVLSASFNDDKIAWYENQGNGQFSSEIIISTNATGAQSIYAQDLNGDGNYDVLSASNYENKIAWYQNLGNGTFSDPIIISSNADDAKSVFAQDLDGDGDYDVLSASSGDDKIAWYENLGDGQFSPEIIISSNANSAWSVFAQDLDGDGDYDVLSASSGDDKIAWYENLGNGQFSPEIIISSNADYAISVFAQDLDGDGDYDVLSASSGDDKIAWYENLGNGQFSPEIILSSNANNARSVFAQDLDGDGDYDVLSASRENEKTAWHENQGSGQFSSEIIISSNTNGARSAYAQDLDGDGDYDVLSASYNDDKITWHENDGSGQFSSETLISSNANGVQSVYAQDLNGDGNYDVLSASLIDDKIAWYENLGGGQFSSEIIISSNANEARSVYAQDLDGDEDYDVLSASFNDGKIAWYENQGNGQFSSEIIISSNAGGASSVYSQDLDGDGDYDVLSASYNDGKIAWYENQGNGQFSSEIIISSNAGGASSVYSQDLDGDGDYDVVSTLNSEDNIVWYENLGNGQFSSEIIITYFSDNAFSVYAQDLDSDGDFDVISCSYSSDNIQWFENLGNGTFSENILISSNVDGAYSVYSQDLDGDGDYDVLSASSRDDKIAWYENLGFFGCNDPSACNYDENAAGDNGSCCFGDCGCTFPTAFNYNPEADCDDNSCQFNIQGYVFFDENENGVWDLNEPPLSFQEVSIEPSGWTTWTNDEGRFNFDALTQNYTVEVVNSDLFPFNTTTNPRIVVVTESIDDLLFGVSNEQPDFDVVVDFYPPGSGYLCDDWVNHNICFRNTGNVPIDGIVEVEMNVLFQDYMEVTPIDSVNGNTLYMSFDNLLPGQMYFYDVELRTPTVDYIGELITSTARVYGYYEGEEVAYGEEELTVEMTCAYDPNDKQVFPNGYAEPHFILNDTQLEYLVRFQNTGNAPATNVLVTDTLDENLNLETFAIMANSHSVQATLKPEERVVEFLFENIMLPDSNANEPESHGLVSFVITPYTALDPGTELNNTANIYFDNNPPIITNTTWNTIYECTEALATVENVPESICSSEELILENNEPFIETYSWSSGIDVLSEESLLQTNFDPGMQVLLLEVENPLCVATNTMTIDVLENPEIDVTKNASICFGEEITISATSEDEVEWLGVGPDPEQTVSPTETQEYIAVASNEEGCETEASVLITVNPNPTADAGSDLDICVGESIDLTATGGDTYHWTNFDEGETITVSPDQDAVYEVTVTNVFNCSDTDEVNVQVNENPDTPEISISGNDLLSDPAESYQWYLNGEAIDGATDQAYIIEEDGDYSVEVTNAFGCSTRSEGESLVFVGLEELSRWNDLKIYPNPASNIVVIETGVNQGMIEIYDARGRLVLSEVLNQSRMQLDVSGFADGVYQIKVSSKHGSLSKKLVISNR